MRSEGRYRSLQLLGRLGNWYRSSSLQGAQWSGGMESKEGAEREGWLKEVSE